MQRASVSLLALESIGLAALTVWEVISLVRGDLSSLATSLALLVMTLVATGALAGFAFAVHTGRAWGRSGGIVAQVLIFAVAVGAVQGADAHWGIAAALALPAIATFAALIGSARPSDETPRD